MCRGGYRVSLIGIFVFPQKYMEFPPYVRVFSILLDYIILYPLINVTSLMTCYSSLCPVRSHSMVCGENIPNFQESSLYSSKISSNYFSSDINLVHVSKRGISYWKYRILIYITDIFSFQCVFLFRSASVFVEKYFRFFSCCVFHYDKKGASNFH